MLFSESESFPQNRLIKSVSVFAHSYLASLASSHRFFNHSVSREDDFMRHLWGKHDMHRQLSTKITLKMLRNDES